MRRGCRPHPHPGPGSRLGWRVRSGWGSGCAALVSRGNGCRAPAREAEAWGSHRHSEGLGERLGSVSPRECPSISRDSPAAVPCRRVWAVGRVGWGWEVSPRPEGILKQTDPGKPSETRGRDRRTDPGVLPGMALAPNRLPALPCSEPQTGPRAAGSSRQSPLCPRRAALALGSVGGRRRPCLLPGLLLAIAEQAHPRVQALQVQAGPGHARIDADPHENRRWE